MTGNEPIAHFEYPYSGEFGDENKGNNLGLTIRQYFAGIAMQGILSNPYLMQEIDKKTNSGNKISPQFYVSVMAIASADATIAELNENKTNL